MCAERTNIDLYLIISIATMMITFCASLFIILKGKSITLDLNTKTIIKKIHPIINNGTLIIDDYSNEKLYLHDEKERLLINILFKKISIKIELEENKLHLLEALKKGLMQNIFI